ncbi:MAG: MoxR family ATPase [Pseudomonadota bacterium]
MSPLTAAAPDKNKIEEVARLAGRLIDNILRVIVDKREAVTLLLTALFCEGHVILEDVPGVGKTLLAKSAAKSLNCDFRRIQFTPDLMPSDVTGLNWFNQKTCRFEFSPGPIMANIVLADEINRATPRTQSCLLEAMGERQVTIDGETRPLPRPFLVLATQNPVEQAGAFPLPEAQLDRFLFKIKPGYPTAEAEEEILVRFQTGNPLDRLSAAADGADVLAAREACRVIYVEKTVREYLVRLVRATREHDSIRLGASPRAAQGLYHAAQARAAMDGRCFVLPDDVKALAVPTLAHRLLLKPEARLRGRTKENLVEELVATVPTPVE